MAAFNARSPSTVRMACWPICNRRPLPKAAFYGACGDPYVMLMQCIEPWHGIMSSDTTGTT